MSLLIIGERCPSCQKFRSPLEMVQHEGHRNCLPCEQRHIEALECLSRGTPPQECSECNTSWAELSARGATKMVCHMEAGRYRFMCVECDARYVLSRRELYGPTEFGRAKGLN